MSDLVKPWPDPARPGVPMNPEEPRYHWVKGCDGEDTIVFWRGHGGDTHHENGDLKDLDHWSGYPMWIAQDWTYHGPVFTPDGTAALIARIAKLEAALRGLMPTALHYGGLRDCDLAAIKEARAALEGGKKDG